MLIDEILNLIDERTKSHINKYNKRVNKIQEEMNLINAIIVGDALQNSSTSYATQRKIRDLEVKKSEIYSYISLTNYIKSEISKITIVTNDIPLNINILLSPYGTFYDGSDTFYYNKELNISQLLDCLVNHISHYTLGLYLFPQKKQTINRIIQFFAATGLLPEPEDKFYDFNPAILKYFHKIYKDEISDRIFFEPSSNYKNHLLKLAENEIFDKCIIYTYHKDYSKKGSISCYCFLYKTITSSCVYNKLKAEAIDSKLTSKLWIHSIDNSKFFDKCIVNKYSGIDTVILQKLLVNNKIEIASSEN